MRFNDLLRLLKKNLHTIILTGLFFGLAGGLIYFILPPRYTATGTLYITRALEDPEISENNDAVFLYEGFYAGQSAQAYASSLSGILQSRDLHSRVLEDISLEITGKNLRTLKRSIKVSKLTPQVISLQTKGNTPVSAEGLWESLFTNLEEFNSRVGRESDPHMRIVKVTEQPVVSEAFRNIYANFLTGLGIGILLSYTWYVVKEIIKP